MSGVILSKPRSVSTLGANVARIYIAGIGGTFMGALAKLAVQMGHQVSGWDRALYSPMREQIEALDVSVDTSESPVWPDPAPDVCLIGNALGRGHPLVETGLEMGLNFQSGPQWLREQVLRHRRVIAIAGTHGKTTTTAMVTHLLEPMNPGYLIGGVPPNRPNTELGDGEWFVIEADEYDTAFFDKRAKFVHYDPELFLINNLEHDHADIYPSVQSIQWQFHQGLRVQKPQGAVLYRFNDPTIQAVIDQGVWADRIDLNRVEVDQTGAQLTVTVDGESHSCNVSFYGPHNRANAQAAIAIGLRAGVSLADLVSRMGSFEGVARRADCIASGPGWSIYDDFAHHPSAIELALNGFAERAPDAPLTAVIEPRSNTMKLGAHRDRLIPVTARADRVFWLQTPAMDWAIDELDLPSHHRVFRNAQSLYDRICEDLNGQIVLMSNGDLMGLRERLKGLGMPPASPTNPT